jgi:hypothetical protein
MIVRRRSCAEKPADRHRRRSSRRQRPCNRDAAAKSDYFPSPHGFARAKDYIGYKQNIIFLDREAAGRYTKGAAAMSALGQKRTLMSVQPMSALPPKADIAECDRHVVFVPLADILGSSSKRRYSITSSARTSRDDGTVRPRALAVLRLIDSSILVGNSTGRSPGRAPCRILSTK